MKRKVRPEVLKSRTHKLPTPCGSLYLRFGYTDDGELFETFATIGKSGNCLYGMLEAISRLICDIFKYDVETDDKIHALKHLLSINCGQRKDEHTSCLDLIAKKTIEELKKCEILKKEKDDDKKPD